MKAVFTLIEINASQEALNTLYNRLEVAMIQIPTDIREVIQEQMNQYAIMKKKVDISIKEGVEIPIPEEIMQWIENNIPVYHESHDGTLLDSFEEGAIAMYRKMQDYLDNEYKHSEKLAEHWYNYLQALKDIASGTVTPQLIAQRVLKNHPQLNSEEYKEQQDRLQYTLFSMTEEKDEYKNLLEQIWESRNNVMNLSAIKKIKSVLDKYDSINKNKLQ